MGIDVTCQVHVSRPREAVSAFLQEPANDHRWIRALTRPAEVLTESEHGVGTRVRRVAKMAGRTIDYTTEIIAFKPGELVAMKTVDGPPMRVTYSLADADGGTNVRVRNEGGSGVAFALFGPIIARMVRSRVTGDLERLKGTLESG